MAIAQTTTLGGITETPANSSLAITTAAQEWQFSPPATETALRIGFQVQLWSDVDWKYSTDGTNYVPIAAGRVIDGRIRATGTVFAKAAVTSGTLYALRVG